MPGTLNLERSDKVNAFVDYAYENQKLVCAICAAPTILGHKGHAQRQKAVCFPGFESELEGAELSDSFVVTDGNIITAKGMGSAVKFGIAIGAAFVGEAKMKKNRGVAPMLLRDIREEKAAIRSKCRLLRSQFTAEEKKSLDARIFNRLTNLWRYRECGTLDLRLE